VEVETGDVGEDSVPSEERRAHVDCGGCDPQVVGVDWFVERVADLSTGEP
jgi:hypothetical protein